MARATLLLAGLLAGTSVLVGVATAGAATFDVCGTCTHTTLASAVAAAQANGVTADTIRVAQGTHPSGFSDIQAGDTITIEGGWDGTFTTRTVDPTNTVLDGAGGANNVNVFPHGTAVTLSIDGVTLTDVTAGAVIAHTAFPGGPGITLTLTRSRLVGNTASGLTTNTGGPHHITITDTTIAENTGAGVSISGGGSLVLRRNVIHDNGLRGISLSLQNQTYNPIIENNVITANGGGVAINTQNNTGGTFTFTNNTIADNSTGTDGAGLVAADSATNGPITLPFLNNIVRGNSTTGSGNDIHLNGTVTINATTCDIGDVVTINGAVYNDVSGNIDADPLYNNREGGDYRLTVLSPCIDTGTNAGAPADDFEGDPRPLDGDGMAAADSDMGADEFDPNDPPPPATPTPTMTLTPTPTVTPTSTAPTPTVTCTPEPLGPTPTPVDLKTGQACQRAIAKETSKFVKAKAKALQKCHEKLLKGAVGPDPGPGGGMRLDFCLTQEEKTVAKIDKAQSKIAAKISKSCGGDEKVCDGDPSEEDPAALGFVAACPNFENGTCNNAIVHCGDVATCLECVAEAAVDQLITLVYDAFLDLDKDAFPAEHKCQQTIGKEAVKYLLASEKARAKCWDQFLKGKHTDTCADLFPSALLGSVAQKTAQKIEQAEDKYIKKVCKVCGGEDKNCDDQFRSVHRNRFYGNANGGNDLGPTTVGFAPTCPAVSMPTSGGVPELPECGGSIDTLADLVRCVSCVLEFKVDCTDAASRPAAQGYPCQCNP